MQLRNYVINQIHALTRIKLCIFLATINMRKKDHVIILSNLPIQEVQVRFTTVPFKHFIWFIICRYGRRCSSLIRDCRRFSSLIRDCRRCSSLIRV